MQMKQNVWLQVVEDVGSTNGFLGMLRTVRGDNREWVAAYLQIQQI
jgi:hypothetical protein